MTISPRFYFDEWLDVVDISAIQCSWRIFGRYSAFILQYVECQRQYFSRFHLSKCVLFVIVDNFLCHYFYIRKRIKYWINWYNLYWVICNAEQFFYNLYIAFQNEVNQDGIRSWTNSMTHGDHYDGGDVAQGNYREILWRAVWHQYFASNKSYSYSFSSSVGTVARIDECVLLSLLYRC